MNDKYSLYDEEDRYKEMNSKELNKFLDKMKKYLKIGNNYVCIR